MLRRSTGFLLTAAFALTACASPDAATESADLSQESSDVTILKIESADGWLHVRSGRAVHDGPNPTPQTFDAAKCTPWTEGHLDCTSAFEEAFGAPALARIAISEHATLCKPILITTASKKAAVANADGIGSHFNVEPGSEETGDYVTKSELRVVGEAKAKQGYPVVLHRFVALGYCDAGGRWGSSKFKPFMRFYAPNTGWVYDNWDNRPYSSSGGDRNYHYTWNSYVIDRTRELLAP